MLVAHFFPEDKSGKRVRLNVTEQLLCDLGRSHGWNHEDFLDAAARGSALLLTSDLNVCRNAYQLYERWQRNGQIPPFVAYLGLFVYLEATERSFHRALWQRYPATGRSSPPDFYPDFDRMVDLWKGLEDWSIQQLGGSRGVFKTLRLGSLAHLSIPRAQNLLTDAERQRLPELFASAGLTPQSPVPPSRLRQVLDELGKDYLGNLTLRALKDRELSRYLFDDLRNELTLWNGEVWDSDQLSRHKRVVGRVRRTAELVLFLMGAQLTPRLRFETTLEEATESAQYFGVQDIIGNPAPGWSAPVANTNDSPFDASELDWEDNYVWEVASRSQHTNPSQLRFVGREVRVFVSAVRFGMGGLVETDELPVCGRCWVAGTETALNPWIDLLPAQGCSEVPARVPSGWKLYRIDAIPSDSSVRDAFPGGAEDLRPVVRLRGGLRARGGNSRAFHTFAPPRIELGGERGGVDVVITPLDGGTAISNALPDTDGLLELPDNVLAGEYKVEVSREGEIVDTAFFTLLDVVHAGCPTEVRHWADRFGRPAITPSQGRSGGWIQSESIPEFDYAFLSLSGNRSNAREELRAATDPAPVVVRWLGLGIHPGWRLGEDYSGVSSEGGTYPVGYFRDLWLLNDDQPLDARQAAAERIWMFHHDHSLFSPLLGLPIARLLSLPPKDRYLWIENLTTQRHLHRFLLEPCSQESNLETFCCESGSDEWFLKVYAAPGDPYPQSAGPPPQGAVVTRRRRRADTTHYHHTSYDLGWLPDGYDGEKPGWGIGRSRWHSAKGVWWYPVCCDSSGPLRVEQWKTGAFAEHLNLREWLIQQSRGCDVPGEFSEETEHFDSFLLGHTELGELHLRVLEESAPVASRLWGASVTVRSVQGSIPPAGKAAWRIAWMDRLAAWDGPETVFEPMGNERQRAFLRTLASALHAPGAWSRMLESCFGVAEYCLTLLRKGGLGSALRFSPSVPEDLLSLRRGLRRPLSRRPQHSRTQSRNWSHVR